MPELPEVEIMTRNLRRWAAGSRLVEIDLQDEAIVASGALRGVYADKIDAVRRRGKYLLHSVGQDVWVWHFRMTGKLVRDDGRKARIRLTFDNGETLAFLDTRRLGELHILAPGEVEAFWKARNLGDEPYPEVRESQWWRARFAGTRRAIKPALMDQSRVAGIGNIMASETLFRAGVDPRKPTNALDEAEWGRIASAVPAFIDEVLNAESGDEIHYVNDGAAQTPAPFMVYKREGEPCALCGTPIERIVQSGRSTFLCSICQQGDGSGAADSSGEEP